METVTASFRRENNLKNTKYRLRVTDYVEVGSANIASDFKISDSTAPGSSLLMVRIAATHSGIITGNNTFYLPDKMRQGTATWTAQYAKPILTHHNDQTDAVGRVVSARYVDLSAQVPSILKNSTVRSAQLIQDVTKQFLAGKLTTAGEVQYIRDVLVPSGILNDKNYQGMGYSEIIAAITDPDAIQKLRDGRYLTGSVSASTDAAICSICTADWIQDGKCEHIPGQIYDDQRAFLIAGDFEYDEYSWVNRPADSHSRALELVNCADIVPTLELIHDSVKDTTAGDIEEVFQKLDITSDSLTEVEEELIYELLSRELPVELGDAKLSTEKRKGLASSTFCGPGRSFPVPDCAHVTAARRLVGRYKGPGDKNKILACVDRKAKSLGCDSKDSSTTEATMETVANTEEQPVEVKDETVATEVAASQETSNTEEVKAAETTEEVTPVVTDDKAVEEGEEECKSCKKVHDTHLEVLREEIKHLYDSLRTTEDQLIATQRELRDLKAQRVSDWKILCGAEVGNVTDITSLDDNQLNTLLSSVDMKKIADKLNSGLTNSNPKETISDPSATNTSQQTVDISSEDSEVSQKIARTYQHFLDTSGRVAAERYLEKMRREGYAKYIR